MRTQHTQPVSRRKFLGGLTLVGTVGLLGLHPGLAAAEPPPRQESSGWRKAALSVYPPCTWPKISCRARGLPRSNTS